MSRLQELINELCPNGVEWKKLGEVCEVLDNKRKPITKSARVAGNYPYYGANGIQDYVADYIFDGRFVLVGEDGSVQNKNGNPIVNWAEGKIWVNNHAHIISEKQDVLLRYIFFYLQTINVAPLIHGNIPKLTGGDFRLISIPVPPLPVQEEIVRILDRFADLAAELQAELQARKEQYEYYRNKLLTFSGVGVEWKKMSEIGTFVRGSGLQKKDFTESGVGCIHYGQIYTRYGTSATRTYSYVSEEFAKKCRKAKCGDLVIATTSENDEDVCKAVAWLGKEDIAVSSDACFFSHNQDSKYVAYFFKTESFQSQKKKYITGTKVRRVNVSDLGKILIPIPPLAEQCRIADILDRFEALTTDLSAGLPAEIEAVRQQYEYYRNKLLTFKRLTT